MRLQKDAAVSPVVGVMLMLVVVIIIAAIVSAFSGGLVSTNNKAPQATIQGKYSASSSILQMYHAGGDELSTSRIFVVTRVKDEENGGFSGTMSRSLTNKSFIFNSAGTPWLDAATGIVKVPVWHAGETMYYNQSISSTVGNSFTLEIDTIDGKLVSKSDVKIDP
jgi:archaeal type IV pilus assembly protein PilA